MSIRRNKTLIRVYSVTVGLLLALSALSLFWPLVDVLLTGLTGIVAFIDDNIIASETHDELSNLISSAIERTQKYGSLVQVEKCQLSGHRSINWVLYLIKIYIW